MKFGKKANRRRKGRGLCLGCNKMEATLGGTLCPFCRLWRSLGGEL